MRDLVRVGSGLPGARKRLALVALLAFGIRLLAAGLIGEAHVPWNFEYEEIANNLITHGEYAYSFYDLTPPRPTSFLPPVYPIFLALVRYDTPAGHLILQLVQIAASLGAILCLYALARELGLSEGPRVLAALFMAIYPPAVAYAVDVSTVAFETLFVIAGAWWTIRAATRGSYRAAVGAGVSLAFAALTRSTWIVLVPLAAVWIMWYCRSAWATRSWQALLMLVSAAVVLVPWIGYNYSAQGEWLLTSTNGGLNFWIGNNPQATGEYIFPTTLDRAFVLSTANLPEVARDRVFYTRGLEFIQSSPGQFLELFGRKLLYFLFFRPNIGSTYEGIGIPIGLAAGLFVLAWLGLIPFALLGLVALGKRWREHAWLMVIFVSQAALTVAYFTGTRFRVPMDGFIMIWAAVGVDRLVDAWRRKQVAFVR